jgi:transcriptional regulator GlxA family with amidase domain
VPLGRSERGAGTADGSICTGGDVLYVEALRVERARTALQQTEAPTETIARLCGFGSAEVMRRAFQRRLGVPPTVYRERFAATG